MQPPLWFTSGNAAPIAIVTSAEIVVATLPGVVTPYGPQTIKLDGHVMVTSGSTSTAVVCRIRRASLTGTLVGDQTGQSVITAAAGTNFYEVWGQDNPGDVTGFTYVLTVQDTGGGTGGTTIYAILNAWVS